jgi:serine/threonine-protein kinase HipA
MISRKPSQQECFVYITLPNQDKPITAGKFAIESLRDGTVVGRFVYGRSYLARTDAVPIDPVELRLNDATYETVRMLGMFGALRDASPDHWGRLLIERHLGRADVTEMEFLLNSPDDRIGALGFGLNPQPPAPQRTFNRMIDLARLQEIANNLAEGYEPIDSRNTQVEELLLIGTSVGGARPKAVVADGDDLWIAKFNLASDRWNNARVEHAMLLLARECGLQTAQSRIETVGEKDVVLVKRFDRERLGEGYARHRMISALTVLRTDDEVVGRSAWSYPLLVEELRRFGAEPKKDAEELFRRMVFNALITNNDDHPRNHAFLASNTWRLAPAYDLSPMPMLSTERRDLAMTVGRWGRWANVENLLSECHRFMLSPQQARAVIDQMSTIVSARWHAIARSAGVTERDCELLSPAFCYPGLLIDPEQTA